MKTLTTITAVIFVAIITVLSCSKPASTNSNAPQPTAQFSFSVSSSEGLASFTDNSTNATGYLWNFGDNTTSNSQNPVHAYQFNGSYNVKFTASNSGGSATTNQVVTITNVSGQEVFWSNSQNKGGSYIDVYLTTNTGSLYVGRISSYFSSAPSCYTTGCATFTGHGIFPFHATGQDGTTWNGYVTPSSGTCTAWLLY